MAKLTAGRILEIIDDSVAKWVIEQGAEQNIVRKVRQELDQSLEAIIYCALGIKRDRHHPDQIEIDARSPGYKLLQKKVESAAQGWLEENFDIIEHQLTTQEISDLKRHFAKQYNYHLLRALTKLAAAKVEHDAKLIVERVGLSTDKMREALRELITEENRAKAAEEAARGREFLQRTKLKSAEVRGVVVYDGQKLSPLIQEPDATCWHVMRLQSRFGDIHCHILTNGKEWHPFHPDFIEDGLDCGSSRVLENFVSSRQMIFNFLDEADRLCIADTIAAHYQNSNDVEGEISF